MTTQNTQQYFENTKDEGMTDDELNEKIDQYAELKPTLDAINALKGEIAKEVVRRGSSYAHGNVNVTFRKGGTRTSWNTDGLKGYAVANPDVLNFMKVTETDPSASVSVKK